MRNCQTLAACLIIQCSFLPLNAAESNLALARALDSIRVEDIRDHSHTLASDSFEGREAGKAGGRASATYIMKAARRLGLRPAGIDGTYFQPFGAGYRNVLAVLPGTDVELPDEYVIVSAHYDHVGYGTAKNSNGPVGYIHNGADDNASGVAAVLELAEALQNYSPGVARTVLFVWFDAEEKGLWGSKYWLEHPTIDLANTKLIINVDMVGRLRQHLELFGTRSMPGLRAAWSKANLDPHLKLSFPWRMLDNSDHFPFFERGIPVTMVHSGLHEDYHRPSDDVHRLNLDGIHTVSELLLRFMISIANEPTMDDYRVASKTESTAEQRHYERPHAGDKQRIGVSWRRAATFEGLSVSAVVVDSMAYRSGLRPGDLITHIGDLPLTNADQLRRAVASTFGKLRLRVRRDNLVSAFEIPLGGKRPRVGVAWRKNAAEPDVVMVSGVIPGFPAEFAGLRRLDRIHSVDGRAVGTDDEFHNYLLTAEGRVELLVERDGQMKQLHLELPSVQAD